MLVLNEISESLSKSKKPLIKKFYDKEGKKLLVIGLRSGIELPENLTTSKAKIMVIQGLSILIQRLLATASNDSIPLTSPKMYSIRLLEFLMPSFSYF